jgi:glycosyltransferase involved in cell wall biosynthesis
MRRPLLISHDLSYSGAPVALLALAKALQRLGENPVVASLAGGPLAAMFYDAKIEVATKIDPAAVSFVIANTILSIPRALRFKRPGTPVAAWVHETAYSFRHLNISPRECGLQDLNVVLAPAKFQLVELEPFLRPGSAYQFRNLVRQDSFRLPDDESMIAVCGRWEARKGQAQLMELVQHSAATCRFKFIGAERPDTISSASPHVFTGPLDPDSAKAEIARSSALVSCSESEAQPLCPIEALLAGRPVLLSDIDAHRTLASLIPNSFLFDRKSPQSFFEGYAKLRDAMPDKEAGFKASAIAGSLFGEAAFERRLIDVLKVLRGDVGSAVAVEHFQDP